jgi:hypothetical protein
VASLRIRQRSDGSANTWVLYMLNGKQPSSSFDDHAEAVRFQELANKTSPAKAMEVWATQTPGAVSKRPHMRHATPLDQQQTVLDAAGVGKTFFDTMSGARDEVVRQSLTRADGFYIGPK